MVGQRAQDVPTSTSMAGGKIGSTGLCQWSFVLFISTTVAPTVVGSPCQTRMHVTQERGREGERACERATEQRTGRSAQTWL